MIKRMIQNKSMRKRSEVLGRDGLESYLEDSRGVFCCSILDLQKWANAVREGTGQSVVFEEARNFGDGWSI